MRIPAARMTLARYGLALLTSAAALWAAAALRPHHAGHLPRCFCSTLQSRSAPGGWYRPWADGHPARSRRRRLFRHLSTLSVGLERQFVMEMLSVGASGYLLKDCPFSEL